LPFAKSLWALGFTGTRHLSGRIGKAESAFFVGIASDALGPF